MPDGATSGTLYLVATPIGNLEDITLRAVRVLAEVGCIAAEDTRRTRKLLSHHRVHAELVSYREESHPRIARRLLDRLRAGQDVALVCDAGTPGISDPGQALVAEVVRRGIRVVPLPGPSAAIAALAASGLPTDRFLFVGFLPRKAGALRKLAQELAWETGSLILHESPRRLGRTLGVLAGVWGPRLAVVARELTKLHETFDRGSLPELAERYAQGTRGEVTLVVEGAGERTAAATPALYELVEALQAGRRLSPSEIARLLGKLSGLGRKAVYAMAVVDRRPKKG